MEIFSCDLLYCIVLSVCTSCEAIYLFISIGWLYLKILNFLTCIKCQLRRGLLVIIKAKGKRPFQIFKEQTDVVNLWFIKSILILLDIWLNIQISI